jgi:ferritin-like metal-binding protein YciE
MKFASLNDLYLQQLKDLHSAEGQLIKALPKMAKAARNPELKNAFIEHLGCRDHRDGPACRTL